MFGLVLLAGPARADVYTRPGAQKLVVDYFAAEDMGEAEKKPPFIHALPSKAPA